jgi:hypothetical protein
MEVIMLRNLAFVVSYVVIQVLSATASVWAADFGTAQEAKAMLEKAVAAVKEDKVKALDMFNKGEGGFKDRDLYVWCANASDGIITATPYWTLDHVHHSRRQDIDAVSEDVRERVAQEAQALADGDAALEQEGPDLVDDGGARPQSAGRNTAGPSH